MDSCIGIPKQFARTVIPNSLTIPSVPSCAIAAAAYPSPSSGSDRCRRSKQPGLPSLFQSQSRRVLGAASFGAAAAAAGAIGAGAVQAAEEALPSLDELGAPLDAPPSGDEVVCPERTHPGQDSLSTYAVCTRCTKYSTGRPICLCICADIYIPYARPGWARGPPVGPPVRGRAPLRGIRTQAVGLSVRHHTFACVPYNV